jgi:hypothetical protein
MGYLINTIGVTIIQTMECKKDLARLKNLLGQN